MKKLSSIFLVLTLTNFSFATRQDIATFLRKVTEMNEVFKSAVTNKAPDYKAKGEQVEKYYQKIVVPNLDKMVQEISRSQDKSYMDQVLKFHISLRNFADENLIVTLANEYQANPDLFEKSFKDLKPQDRKLLYADLEFGWQNLFHEKKKTPEQEKLTSRLKKLSY